VRADVPQKTAAPLLQTNADEAAAATLVANLMTRYHYQAQPLDDQMSGKIFKAYLDALDSQKVFFSQRDIDSFAAMRTSLDDDIWNGDLAQPFKVFNLYVERLQQRIACARQLLVKGFDFSKQESWTPDRSKAAWPADTAALDEVWRQRVKNDWLRLKLAGRKDADIRKLLDKRYAGYLSRVRQLKAEDVFQTFMNAYAESTDPHTNYFDPRASENFDIAMRLSLEGIGAVLEARDDYTQVREIVPGGPASRSTELHAGDRIVGVGQGAKGEIVDVVGWRLDDVVDKIRGPKNSVVRLEILPADAGLDGKHKIIELVRKKVTIAEQAAKKSVIEVKDGDQVRRIGVIDLPTFYQDFAAQRRGDPNYRSASRDVGKLLAELKQEKVDGVIMDLRNNGGGSLPEAVALTGLFIHTGPVVQVRDWRGKIEEQNDDDAGMAWSGPMAVLVNRGSASASEIFTAAIQDYGRGLVIGSDTFGKGTVQNLVDLDHIARNEKPKFGELKMTIAQFFRINGGSTQLRGVTPDIVFPSSIDKKDLGESSYDNALPWTSIAPAPYKPVADSRALLPALKAQHDARAAKDPEWQLQVAEIAQYRAIRDRKTLSLNFDARQTQRKADEAARKALLDKTHKEEASVAAAGSSAAPATAGSVASAARSKLAANRMQRDDGLQPGERSLKSELAAEAAAKKAPDVQLHEAANILADEINAIQAKPALAAKLLPTQTHPVD
ncbi:MAG TPA: carboxy terminal-processing peptidase, partial [Rhodanobacteraceae bacterium]|nr:carboxy terminal-processing peptidase [Rhodanobacteraceae bacterium]